MEEHAGSIAHYLDQADDVVVVTKPGLGVPLRRGRIVEGLTGNTGRDAALLREQRVDCWLAMSAPLVALAPLVAVPMYGYVHGLDAVRPWGPNPPGYGLASRVANRLGLPLEPLVTTWRKRRIKAGLDKVRGLFCNSGYTAALVCAEYGLARDTVAVVHPGVDEDFLTVERVSSGGPLRLVLIARLQSYARRKNVDGVLRALAMVAGDLDIVLRIIGSGDDVGYLTALADELGLGARVVFEGGLSHEGVKAVFALSDGLILAVRPNETDVEGFGMVYAEAACAGLPSIAVDTGGVSEAVDDGRTGILLDSAEPAAIAEGIRRFARIRNSFDPGYLRDYGRQRTARQTTRRLRELIAG